MYSKRIRPTARPAGSSVHESESESVRVVAQAISKIPELSHGIQDRCPRHSKHPSLLAMPAVFPMFSIILVGRFTELTPVRSQATSRGFLPWMPVTWVVGTSQLRWRVHQKWGLLHCWLSCC